MDGGSGRPNWLGRRGRLWGSVHFVPRTGTGGSPTTLLVLGILPGSQQELGLSSIRQPPQERSVSKAAARQGGPGESHDKAVFIFKMLRSQE